MTQQLEEQSRLAAVRLGQVEQLTLSLEEKAKENSGLLARMEVLTRDKEAAESLAIERQSAIDELRARVEKLQASQEEQSARQALVKQELLKTEGQVDLIRRLLLPESGL